MVVGTVVVAVVMVVVVVEEVVVLVEVVDEVVVVEGEAALDSEVSTATGTDVLISAESPQPAATSTRTATKTANRVADSIRTPPNAVFEGERRKPDWVESKGLNDPVPIVH